MKRHATLGVLLGIALAVGCTRVTSQQGGGAEMIDLPEPKTEGEASVEAVIAARRSIRSFSDQALTAAEIGQLAWAAQGVTDRSRGLRAAPSAGATYPLELYVVTPEGLLHYQPDGHKMRRVRDEDLRGDLAQAALGQSSVSAAAADFVIAAVYERTAQRYGARAERYVHIEVGHAAQNIHLQAVALGLGSVPVGAFDDAAVARVVGLPDNQRPLYIIPVGHLQAR